MRNIHQVHLITPVGRWKHKSKHGRHLSKINFANFSCLFIALFQQYFRKKYQYVLDPVLIDPIHHTQLYLEAVHLLGQQFSSTSSFYVLLYHQPTLLCPSVLKLEVPMSTIKVSHLRNWKLHPYFERWVVVFLIINSKTFTSCNTIERHYLRLTLNYFPSNHPFNPKLRISACQQKDLYNLHMILWSVW